jgi:hypothetical protein
MSGAFTTAVFLIERKIILYLLAEAPRIVLAGARKKKLLQLAT